MDPHWFSGVVHTDSYCLGVEAALILNFSGKLCDFRYFVRIKQGKCVFLNSYQVSSVASQFSVLAILVLLPIVVFPDMSLMLENL